MSGITKSWRLTADGSQVKREFTEIGRHGEQMERKIRDGARGMAPALRAVDAAAAEARGSLESAAANAGGFGNVLRAIGPAGLVAAAGIGALVVGFTALQDRSREAADALGEIYVAASRINTSVEFLQEYRYAMVQLGEDARVVDASLQRFSVKLGELATKPANELRSLLSQYGIGEELIQNMTTVEGALPIIADRVRELGTAAEDAALLQALGLEQMLPLLSQGSENIARLRDEARALGIVLDENTVRRAEELSSAWEAADYVLGVQLKATLLELTPYFLEVARVTADLATSIRTLTDNMKDFADQASSTLARRLDDIAATRARLRSQNPVVNGVDPLAGGNASNYEDNIWEYAGSRIGAMGANLRGANVDLPRNQARDQWAYINEQAARITAVLNDRERNRRLPGPTGGVLGDPPNTATDPRIAQAEALIERLREEERAREDLLALQLQFPGASDQENQARIALLNVMRDLEEARRLGVIATDAEYAALQDIATANYNAAAATRAAAEAERERQEVTRTLESYRRSIETPSERRAREERELRDLYQRSQTTENPMTNGELERGLRGVREEYERLAAAQYEASFEGRVLQGVMDGQIRSMEDVLRLLGEMAINSVAQELLAGGVRGEGGFVGFGRRVLGRFGDAVTGGEGGSEAVDAAAEVLRESFTKISEALGIAHEALGENFTPSIGKSVSEMILSTVTKGKETLATNSATVSIAVMTKAAEAAATALAKVGAGEESSGLVSAIVSAVTGGGGGVPKGVGKASGGALYRGVRHAYAEGGQAELLLLGGNGHVFSNDTLQSIVDLGRRARGASAESGAAAGAPRVSITLRDESGAKIALDDARSSVNADGTLDVEIFIGRQMAGQVARGNVDRAISSRYGLKPQRVRRG